MPSGAIWESLRTSSQAVLGEIGDRGELHVVELQIMGLQVRVPHGGDEAGVSHDLLKNEDVSPVSYRLGGEGMPQNVRGAFNTV